MAFTEQIQSPWVNTFMQRDKARLILQINCTLTIKLSANTINSVWFFTIYIVELLIGIIFLLIHCIFRVDLGFIVNNGLTEIQKKWVETDDLLALEVEVMMSDVNDPSEVSISLVANVNDHYVFSGNATSFRTKSISYI
jgi:hypothetical protein